jgi:5'-3' exonuclease
MVLDELDEEESDADQDEVEDVIADIEDECSSVLENDDNAKLLNEIFDAARANYEKDRRGWNDFFADLKFELISTDDEDNIRDILAHYLRKAKLELS